MFLLFFNCTAFNLQTHLFHSFSLIKEAARAGVPLQYDVVSFGSGQKVSHLESRWACPQYTVVMVMGDVGALL